MVHRLKGFITDREMSLRVQRVLEIQDASIELSVHAITWALCGLSLQPGDKIKDC